MQSKVMLFSLCTKTNEDVTVHYFNASLDQQTLNELKKYLNEKCSANLKIYNIDSKHFKNFPVDRIPYESYSRLIAQFVLPKDLDRVLWLDGDVIVLKDISKFYHQDFENNYYVVCPDIWDGTDTIENIKKKLNINKESSYFNSGVMLMNLDKLRKETNMLNVLDKCNKIKDNMTFHDQDLLNHIYFDKVKLNDWRLYNCQRSGKPKEMNIDYDKDVFFIHYTGIRKPWDYKFLDKLSKYWWREYIKQDGINGIFKTVSFYIKGTLFKIVEKTIKFISSNLYNKVKKLIWKV